MARPLPTRGLGSRFRDAYRRIARRRPLCHECGRTHPRPASTPTLRRLLSVRPVL
jgi:hypothetical protein